MGLLFAPLMAVAQLPNDSCDAAIEVTLGTTYTLNTTAASSAGDPTNVCSAVLGKGVWFRVTPERSGILTLSTCGSGFDTLMGIYTGSCDSLTPFSCADDSGPACPGIEASCSFP